MADHAYLSPSASHRWLHCTMAPSLEAQIADEGSVYAEEGTLAHAICEAKLREFLEAREAPDGSQPRTAGEIFFAEHGHNWEDDPLYNEEMEDTSDYYYNEVIMSYTAALEDTPDAKLLVETKLTIMPQLFGIVDATIIADGLLKIFDYKHGKGVRVSAEQNPQMMIYAIGAYYAFSDYYNISKISMTIVQPRIYNTSSFAMAIDDLLKWNKDTLMPTAVKILTAKELSQEAGSWCKFCKIKRSCRKLAEMAAEMSSKDPDPHMLTIEEVAALLPKVDTIKMWCEAITSYALDQALGGVEVPGYKLVEGRSKGVVSDEEGLVSLLLTWGKTPEEIYKPKELQTITALEKLCGKTAFNKLCGDFLSKTAGKPTLVTLDDKRPAIGSGSAADDFKDVNIK